MVGWNRNASYFFSTWMELGCRLANQKTESYISISFMNVQIITTTLCCAKMAGPRGNSNMQEKDSYMD